MNIKRADQRDYYYYYLLLAKYGHGASARNRRRRECADAETMGRREKSEYIQQASSFCIFHSASQMRSNTYETAQELPFFIGFILLQFIYFFCCLSFFRLVALTHHSEQAPTHTRTRKTLAYSIQFRRRSVLLTQFHLIAYGSVHAPWSGSREETSGQTALRLYADTQSTGCLAFTRADAKAPECGTQNN